MLNAILILLILAVLGLALTQNIQGKRLAILRRRARRSMLVGPEAHIRLQKQVYERLAAADCRSRGANPALPIEFRSEWGEDVLLYELFDGRPDGVFVEVGALDGRRLSVSWIFEAIGWKGLLVEPIPEKYEECRRQRPGSCVVRGALGPGGSAGTIDFVVPLEDDLQGSSHRDVESAAVESINGLRDADAKTRRIRVPLMSMDDALEQAKLVRVDFASIDVEGAELDVLRGFDLARFQVRVLVIEDLTLGQDIRVPDHLAELGYVHTMWIGGNRVFVRRDDAEMMARAQRLAETVYSPLVRPRGHNDTWQHDLR